MPNPAPSTPQATRASAWPHVMAMVLVCATFPLIWVGGLVTTYDAGMSVPDWPSTYGYNLFLYPWETWILGPFDLFIEHGHRLLGALVGMIAIALVIVAWCFDGRSWFKWLSVAALALVIGQGVLGGMRVTENAVQLARIHGIVGPAFFALAVALAVVTSRLWRTHEQSERHAGAGKLQRIAVLTTVLVFVQLVIGAHLRHLPVDFSPGAFRAVVFFHLFIAAALVVHGMLLASRVVFQHRRCRALFYPALALALLIVVQVGLGGATWVANYSWPDWATQFGIGIGHTIIAGSYCQALVVTSHQAMGSLILGVGVMFTLRSFRLLTAGAEQSIPTASLQGVLA